MREPYPEQQSGWLQRLRHLVAPNIRGKIIIPYLVLTLVVAVIGTYVVTSLVAGSLDERLTNQVLEAGRVVSDSLARQETGHLNSARMIIHTRGVAEGLQAHDRQSIIQLVQPVAIGQEIECLILLDAQSQETLHLLQQDDGSYQLLEGQIDPTQLWIAQALLQAGDPRALPRRSLGLHQANQRYYYFTAIPVGLGEKLVGVAIIGTSLNTLLPEFKRVSLADLIIYLDQGRAIATTFISPDPAELLKKLSISPQWYERSLYSTGATTGENLQIAGRWYRLARGPLRLGNENLGVFAVALPLHFVLQAGVTSRDTYAILFTAAMAGVVLIGYLISWRITRPIGLLVQTSRAVAEGDLERRTGITSEDEIGVLATTFDAMTERLSERTRALEDLLQNYQETASRLRAILHSIGDAVLLNDAKGNFIPLNTAGRAMLAEMTAGSLLDSLRELSSDEERAGSDLGSNPWLLKTPRFQMGKRVYSVHSADIRTDEGERLGMVIVMRDVTAEAEVDKLKDAFIEQVSHELRTPLTVIKGYSSLLLSGASGSLDQQQNSFLTMISRHADNLIAMINGLLDFSEMEARGHLGLQRQPVHLSTLVEEIAEDWQPQMDEKGLLFQLQLPAELPPIEADPARLHWAIVNLIRNAWQYTPTGGTITVRLRTDDSHVVLDVMDTGIGISPENQKNLFTRFSQRAITTEDSVRGLGLGLYLAKVIVEAHGGEIQVTSAEGSGSTFSLILPVKP